MYKKIADHYNPTWEVAILKFTCINDRYLMNIMHVYYVFHIYI